MQAAQTSSIFLVSRLCHHTLEKADEDQTATAVAFSQRAGPRLSPPFCLTRNGSRAAGTRIATSTTIDSFVSAVYQVAWNFVCLFVLVSSDLPAASYLLHARTNEDEEAALSQLLTKPSAKTTGNKGNLSHYLCRYAYGQLSPPIGVALPGISSSDTTKLCVTCRLYTKCGQSDAPPEGSVCTTTRDGCNGASQRSIFIIGSFVLSGGI